MQDGSKFGVQKKNDMSVSRDNNDKPKSREYGTGGVSEAEGESSPKYVQPKKKRKIRKRRIVSIAFSLISLSIIIYIAVTLITGRELTLPGAGLFSPRVQSEPVDEFLFDVGGGRVLADLGGSVAAVGSIGIQVFDLAGNETLRDPFRMFFPAVESNGKTAIAFDIGGTSVRVFDSSKIITALETSGAIISASLGNNGRFIVCTQESGAYRGTVTVYSAAGFPNFKVELASGYVLSAALSPDGKAFVILALTETGSRLIFYDLDSEIPLNTVGFSAEIVLDICYLPRGELLVLSENSLFTLDLYGAERELYSFYDDRLGGYSLGDEYIALQLLEYGVGHSGKLVLINIDGEILGELPTDRQIVSMSSGDDFLAVLYNTGPMLYNKGFEEIMISDRINDTAGATGILALSDAVSAVAYGDHSAILIEKIGG